MVTTIICRAHRRRCYMAPATEGGQMRLWHEGVGRSGGNLCSSKLFLFREEQEYSLDGLLNRYSDPLGNRDEFAPPP